MKYDMVKKIENLPTELDGEKIAAKRGNYYVMRNNTQDILFVYSGKKYYLKMEVSEYKSRPIEANWINVKLIYLQISFNPKYGGYWIYDVEKEKVVAYELENDGEDMWLQCRDKKQKQGNSPRSQSPRGPITKGSGLNN